MKIRFEEGRGAKPWCLDVGTIMGKRMREYFETEPEAIAAKKLRTKIRKHHGEEALAMPLPVRLELLEFWERAKKLGATPMQILLYYEAHALKLKPVPIHDAVTACIAAKEAAGNRKVYTKALKRSLDALAVHCRGETTATVTQSQIEAWARTGQGGAVAIATTRSRLIDARTLFNFCLKRKWLIENPCHGIEPVKLEEKPPGIHTVAEVERVLSHALKFDPALIGYLAPIYFGGLRPSEAMTLTKAEVHAEAIEVQGPKGKSRRRRFVPINATLRAWLAVPGVEFGMSPRSRRLLRLRRIIKKETGKVLPWPHDVLRHSFCSYSMATYGAKETAQSAGHSEAILFAHYRERVKPDDAKAYWALRP